MKSLFLRAAFLTALFASSARLQSALDVNGDGVPDIWALRYGSGSLVAGDDADGDGITNAVEGSAGTDPFDPESTIRIRSVSRDSQSVRLIFPTEIGKLYQMQVSSALAPASWGDYGSALAGTGEEVEGKGAPPAGGTAFFRVLVNDVDTDEDGVTDWEEIALGFDPANDHSNGLNGLDDLSAITQGLKAPSVVSVSASNQIVSEPAVNNGSTESATLTVTRSGGFAPLTVSYTIGGSAVAGSDYVSLSGTVQIPLGGTSANISVNPLADTNVESAESVIVTLQPGVNYTLAAPTIATVLINDLATPNGDGLLARFYNETNALNPADGIPPGSEPTWNTLVLTRVDPVVDYAWPTGTTEGVSSPAAGVHTDYFACRWSGEVLPEFSQIYTFELEQNRCGRLWVNGQLLINKWPGNNDGSGNPSGTYSATIALQGGVRYPIVLEHFETTGDAGMHLRWQSANQPKEVIPTARMFSSAPPQILSAREVLLLEGSGPTSYQISASGTDPKTYTAANLPVGWTVNANTGLISGSADQAGVWEVAVSAANAQGVGSAIVKFTVVETGGQITREVWTGIPGTDVSSIPLETAPASTGTVSSLESPQNAADNFGARLRGYLTAPETGVYKFWLTAADEAELWISDDAEPVNVFRRAAVTTATPYRGWSDPNAGKTQLLWLEAGERYYLEVRHKAGVGADHVSVGWLKPSEGGIDPATAPTPSAVVPGYALSPYVPPAIQAGESTLFTTSLRSQGAAQTNGFGSASLRLSADETQAVLAFSYANLTSVVTSKHIHSDANGGQIIFDIDDVTPQQDGSYVWDIVAVGAISASDIVNLIKAGDAYLNIHTAVYPAGEIRGNFVLQAASQTFTPPPTAPSWTDDHTDPSAAARFLIQATYGVDGADGNGNAMPDAIEEVQSTGYEAWIDAQFNLPPTYHYPYVFTNRDQTGGNTFNGSLMFNSWWKNAVTAPDQLRQRVAFALSEILVISENGVLDNRADTLSDYYDGLLDHAFGNFRDLLEDITLHPAMGRYLDMFRNDKPDLATGKIPNENYAREVLQLFSIGLNRMWPDGSLILSSTGELIPTYDQDTIIGFAHAFTGWDYHYDTSAGYRTSFGASSNWLEPMSEVPRRHFTGQKRILNHVVLPGLPTVGGQPLDPFGNHGASVYNDPSYQALARQEIEATHDAIFNHPNTGPFVCRQLIQRLVTSTPSRGYLYRVVQKFNDDGSGVRGDLKSVIKAILLDYEARSPAATTAQGYGKQKEPVVRVAAIARAFPPPPPVSGTYSQTGSVISVTTSAPHFYADRQNAELIFSGGTNGDPDDAVYRLEVVNANQFTTRALSSEDATYQQTGTTLTLTFSGNGHGYRVGEVIYIDFTSGNPSEPGDGLFTIDAVSSDDTTLTVTAPDSVNRTGEAVTTRAAYVADTTGNVSVQYSDWNMNNTDTDLNQTPMNSPTVFNFFLPDYQFPGSLAQAGLITPEFQLTSETSVIRQANFLYNGLFNRFNAIEGISSFKSDANDIIIDLRNFMAAGPGGLPWVHNNNLAALIDRLNLLLMAGQMSPEARAIIETYVKTLSYSSTPTPTQLRDRIRAVVHLMGGSPDFAIQK